MLQIAGAIALVVALLILGNWIYWVGEGSPGTPADFRSRVAETGLDVNWSNNGPRGGDGTVSTDCGRQDITIRSVDGALWLRWDTGRIELTAAAASAFDACETG